MKSALEINGKSLFPIKDAVQSTSYSRDYITRLAREGKIVASNIGRQWFVDIDSLKRYAENIALEQGVRQRLLSQERKREQELRVVVGQQRAVKMNLARSIPVRSAVASFLIVGMGLTAGTFLYDKTPVYISDSILSFLQQSPSESPFVTSTKLMPAQTSGAVVTHTSAADQSSRVAVVTKQSLGVATDGVLLLPGAKTLSGVPELFSDAVAVRESVDGQQTVVLIDEHGDPIGNPVPFVVVPVNERDL